MTQPLRKSRRAKSIEKLRMTATLLSAVEAKSGVAHLSRLNSLAASVAAAPLGSAHPYARAQAEYETYCHERELVPYELRSGEWSVFIDYLSTREKHTDIIPENSPSQRLASSTITNYLFGIAHGFIARGKPSPTWTREHLDKIKTVLADDWRETRKAKPLFGDLGRQLAVSFDRSTLVGARNASVVTLEQLRGFRSADATGILRENLTFDDRGRGLLIRMHISKGGGKQVVVVPCLEDQDVCAVCAMKTYCDLLPFESGPLYRAVNRWGDISEAALNPRSLTYLLRQWLQYLGVPDYNAYSSHSFRHGVVSALVLAGWSLEDIMVVTLHRSKISLREYVTGIDPFYNIEHLPIAPVTTKPVRSNV